MISAPFPSVSIVTSHGRQILNGSGSERLIDLLSRHHVPWSAVSVYAIPESGEAPRLLSCLEQPLQEFKDISEILLYFNRNINPFLFSLTQFKVVDSANSTGHATEYFYQQLDNSRSSSEVFLKKLSPEECQSIIATCVTDTIRECVPPNTKMVIGVSGGGDSNAMLYGLSQLRDHGLEPHPVIIKGVPEWDLGVPRAQELCKKYGLELTVMEESEVKDLLNVPRDGLSLIELVEK